MTVEEFLQEHKYDDMGFWLCPNIVNNSSINSREYECGIEVSALQYVPQFLRDKKVIKSWREEGLWCIIWYNAKCSITL